MFSTGLVSITFRQLQPREIVDLVRQAGLEAIEWGGDVHAPHGNLVAAEDVSVMTRDAGLKVAAYGSYYASLPSVAEGLTFSTVLKTAVALGDPSIRVWAGKKASAEVGEEERAALTRDLVEAAEMAESEGLIITLEYHGGTLTDSMESAVRLMNEADHPALKTLWQPPNGRPAEECLEGLKAALPKLGNVHVFHWGAWYEDRYPLSAGKERWRSFLRVLREEGSSRALLLEFVKGDVPEQFVEDAKTLQEWVTASD